MPWPDVRDADGTRRLVPVELAQTSDREFTLREPLLYVDADGTHRTVPAGFTTDLASVPFPLWSVIGPFGRQTRAAILHDHEVLVPVGGRRSAARRAHVADADQRFRRALREGDVPPFRAE
ncbi:DUF1353 domain-containing protein, partial [Cellulomonas bogoriensis]|uniref:DUF1353 domain-containing protein n=1 Tax=Cellulomonas bogoriensis TaxID=301388 RepID=UPI001E2C9608